MATIAKIIRITNLADNSLHHYDVNYAEGFVVVIHSSDLLNPTDTAEIITKANTKATVIEAQTPKTEIEVIPLP